MAIKFRTVRYTMSAHVLLTDDQDQGKSSSSYTSHQQISTDESVETGANIPGWRSRLKNGLNTTTSLTAARKIGKINNATKAVRQIKYWNAAKKQWFFRTYTLTGSLGAYTGWNVPQQAQSGFINSVSARVQHKFNQKAIAAQRSIQSLVSLGELGETVRMIRRPLQSLFRDQYAYLDLLKKRSRRKRTVKDKARVIADTWLEKSFGWQPLVNDIHQACEALARNRVERRYRQSVSARLSDSRLDSTVLDVNTYPNATNPVIKVEVVGKKVDLVSARIKGSIKLNTDSHPKLGLTTGLTLKDIIPSLWELIPYSFLVDYFTNVGSIIDAWSFHKDHCAWAWKGTAATRAMVSSPQMITFPYTGPDWQNVSQHWVNSEESRWVHALKTRVSWGVVPPDFEFKIPGTTTKWLNIGALALASKRTSSQLSAY